MKSILMSLLILFALTGHAFPKEPSWYAGTGKVVITPEKPQWMAGYAGRKKPAEGKLHDLWAKAIVLKSPEDKTCVLISLDVVGISRELSLKIISRIQEKTKIPREQIVICSTHTHSGPVMGETLRTMYFVDDEQVKIIRDYTVALPDKILEAVETGIKNLEPVTLNYVIGKTDFAVNRRENKETDVPKMRDANIKLKGPVDHSVPVLFAKNADGKIKAVVYGYACHATTLDGYQWSGDWPGFAEIEIEKQFPDSVALFVAGCGGDQNPVPRKTVELAEKYGKMMSDAVKQASLLPQTEVTGNVECVYKEIDLSLGEMPSKEQLEKDAESKDRYISSRAKMLLEKYNKNGKLDSIYPYPVQTWKFHGLNIVFLGGEVVVDYSLRLKSDYEMPNLWVGAYSNDVMSYIPSRRVLGERGYEGEYSMIYYGMPTIWAMTVEDLIVKEAGQQLGKVK